MSGFGEGHATRILKMQDYSSTTISMLILLPLVAVFAVLGNGFVLGIIARFKKFRIFPNILIANLTLIDLLSALINVPMYLLWGVLGAKWFTGKVLAIISLFMTRLCIQSYKKKKKSENAGTGRRTRSRRNQTTPFSSQDSPPKINSPVARVDHYPADCREKF